MTKKELLVLRREKDKLERTLGGIRDMARVPSAVWVVDTNKEHIAVDEARKLGIPVIAILDTNCDPDVVDYPIPGNDDAIRAVALLTRVIADAVADGLMARARGATGGAAEPLAEWEGELLAAHEAEAAEARSSLPWPTRAVIAAPSRRCRAVAEARSPPGGRCHGPPRRWPRPSWSRRGRHAAEAEVAAEEAVRRRGRCADAEAVAEVRAEAVADAARRCRRGRRRRRPGRPVPRCRAAPATARARAAPPRRVGRPPPLSR